MNSPSPSKRAARWLLVVLAFVAGTLILLDTTEVLHSPSALEPSAETAVLDFAKTAARLEESIPSARRAEAGVVDASAPEPWVLGAFRAFAELVDQGHVDTNTRAALLNSWNDEALAVFHLNGGRVARLDPTRKLSYQLGGYFRDEARVTGEDLLPSLLGKLESAEDDAKWELWRSLLSLYTDDPRLIPPARVYLATYWIDEAHHTSKVGDPSKWVSLLCGMAICALHQERALTEQLASVDGGTSAPDAAKAVTPKIRPVLEGTTSSRAALEGRLHELAALRTQILGTVLGVLDEDWFVPSHAIGLLLQLSSGYTFDELAPHLSAILASGKPKASWGVVEALRMFAARDELGSTQLVDLLPTALFYADFPALRLATIELVATFGGERGVALLLALLEDPEADREAVLENLALVGQIGVQRVLELIGDEDLAASAVRALGTLVAHYPDQAYPELRSLALGAPDDALRLEAVRAISRTHFASFTDDLTQVALGDALPKIRGTAVHGIGQDTERHVELFARIAREDPDDAVRGVAFQEWMLDTDDAGLASVFEVLYKDSNESFQQQGFLLMGALAHCTRANPALAEEDWVKKVQSRWQDELLPNPPASLLKQTGWIPDGAVDLAGDAMLSGLDAVSGALGSQTLSERIEGGIAEALDDFASQDNRDDLDIWSSIYASSKETARPLDGLGASLELPQRILQLMGE